MKKHFDKLDESSREHYNDKYMLNHLSKLSRHKKYKEYKNEVAKQLPFLKNQHYLVELSDEDKKQLNALTPFNEKDIGKLLQKRTDFTLEDINMFANLDIFQYHLTPYKPGVPPVSNGKAAVYDLAKNELIPSLEFPDCVETAIRHVVILMTYRDEEFKIPFSEQTAAFNPYSANLEEFYDQQFPDDANSGAQSIRYFLNLFKIIAQLLMF